MWGVASLRPKCVCIWCVSCHARCIRNSRCIVIVKCACLCLWYSFSACALSSDFQFECITRSLLVSLCVCVCEETFIAFSTNDDVDDDNDEEHVQNYQHFCLQQGSMGFQAFQCDPSTDPIESLAACHLADHQSSEPSCWLLAGPPTQWMFRHPTRPSSHKYFMRQRLCKCALDEFTFGFWEEHAVKRGDSSDNETMICVWFCVSVCVCSRRCWKNVGNFVKCFANKTLQAYKRWSRWSYSWWWWWQHQRRRCQQLFRRRGSWSSMCCWLPDIMFECMWRTV